MCNASATGKPLVKKNCHLVKKSEKKDCGLFGDDGFALVALEYRDTICFGTRLADSREKFPAYHWRQWCSITPASVL